MLVEVMLFMHWSWRDLRETPASVVAAALERLGRQREAERRASRSR